MAAAVKVADALAGVSLIFLDTAPVIYLVERNPQYLPVVVSIFQAIEHGNIGATTSPITLAGTLVVPYRLGSPTLQRQYIDAVTNGLNTTFVSTDENIGRHAAELRAQHNLGLADAIQAATAFHTGCDILLTNDDAFRRITDLRLVLLVDDLEP